MLLSPAFTYLVTSIMSPHAAARLCHFLNDGCSDCCNRYYRSVGVIVRCLVLKQTDCTSLIVEASRSIFARDGPATWQAVVHVVCAL